MMKEKEENEMGQWCLTVAGKLRTMQYSLTWCIDSNSVQNGEKSLFIKKLLEE